MKIYELRISLIGSGPEIWRRVNVSGNIRLKKLHEIIQTAMGWRDAHLHQFVVGAIRYADPDIEPDSLENNDLQDETHATLSKVLPVVNGTLVYEYDFGDSWDHLVRVESITASDKGGPFHPVCTEGAGACPPEDCGGLPGYYGMFIPAMLDPTNKEHKSMREWYGRDFDPEVFNRTAVNQALRRI